MRYIKKQFHIETLYMRVESEDFFLKGLAIGFDLKDENLKYLLIDNWLDYKACKHLITEITEEEFNEAYNRMIKQLDHLKTKKFS